MKMTYEQRQQMIGKRFAKDSINDFALLHDVERCAGGFTVKFTYAGLSGLEYMGLKKFIKRFPHEI